MTLTIRLAPNQVNRHEQGNVSTRTRRAHRIGQGTGSARTSGSCAQSAPSTPIHDTIRDMAQYCGPSWAVACPCREPQQLAISHHDTIASLSLYCQQCIGIAGHYRTSAPWGNLALGAGCLGCMATGAQIQKDCARGRAATPLTLGLFLACRAARVDAAAPTFYAG